MNWAHAPGHRSGTGFLVNLRLNRTSLPSLAQNLFMREANSPNLHGFPDKSWIGRILLTEFLKWPEPSEQEFWEAPRYLRYRMAIPALDKPRNILYSWVVPLWQPLLPLGPTSAMNRRMAWAKVRRLYSLQRERGAQAFKEDAQISSQRPTGRESRSSWLVRPRPRLLKLLLTVEWCPLPVSCLMISWSSASRLWRHYPSRHQPDNIDDFYSTEGTSTQRQKRWLAKIVSNSRNFIQVSRHACRWATSIIQTLVW